jgi:CBS-domain-containing membrane protein
VTLTPEARARVYEKFRFRGVRSTYGEVEAYGAGGPTLCDAVVDCQLGVRQRTGSECLRCPRLLSWKAGPTNRDITVRCAWLHSDPVSDRMTGFAALVAVSSVRSCAEADRVAAREYVHRLLVIEDRKLVGIVCRHDLERAAGEQVASIMQREIYVIGASATLGEAASAMRELDVGCLPVTSEQRLVGIITRGDLVRAGLSADVFA